MKRPSVTTVFFVLCVLLIFIPFCLVMITLNYQYSDKVLQYETSILDKELAETGSNLEDQIVKAIYIGASLSVPNKGKLLQQVTQYIGSENPDEKYDLGAKINETINYLVSSSRSNITSIGFYTDAHIAYEHGVIYNAAKSIEPDWYDKTVALDGKPYVIRPLSGEKPYPEYLSIAYKVINGTNHKINVVRVTIKTSAFEKLYYSCKKKPMNQTCILDQNGEKVFAYNMNDAQLAEITNTANLGSTAGTQISGGEKAYVILNSVDKASWKIISIIDYNTVMQPARTMLIKGLMLVSFCVLCFGIFIYILLRNLLLPLKKVSRHMDTVQGEKLVEMEQCNGTYEIKDLIRHFNRMITQLRVSITERERQQKEKSLMEIKVLQSQIMPHFVINTLNSIKLMAVINKQKNIEDMTGAFMKLLDATLSKTGDFVTIKEEIDNLENYIFIMKHRYGENFAYKIDVPEELMACKMLRLLLQPVVENVILHAFGDMQEGGMIDISLRRQENDLKFTITDNGCGMPQYQIDALFEQNNDDRKKYSHIGINNVNQRVKLHYGQNYGLDISSELGRGTQVTISFPVCDEENGISASAMEEI